MKKHLKYHVVFPVVFWLLYTLLFDSAVFAQPKYWQFSYDELIPYVALGSSQEAVLATVVKKRKYFGKYNLLSERRYIDTPINYVDVSVLSGSYSFPGFHKLLEWYDKSSMVVNYSMLFVNGVYVRATLYFIYPNYDMGEIDYNYGDLVSFFQEVGWYPFCNHSLWESGSVMCGHQSNFVPAFEAYYGQDRYERMYRHRLKVYKGLCADSEGSISESIEISFSDSNALDQVLRTQNIEKAAFYGNSYFGFGLDKRLPGCNLR